MKTSIYGLGTRIQVRKGAFPMDLRLIGRTGFVVASNDYKPGRYGVTLEGEQTVREFTEDELEVAAK